MFGYKLQGTALIYEKLTIQHDISASCCNRRFHITRPVWGQGKSSGFLLVAIVTACAIPVDQVTMTDIVVDMIGSNLALDIGVFHSVSPQSFLDQDNFRRAIKT
jgi:hypothetical protein